MSLHSVCPHSSGPWAGPGTGKGTAPDPHNYPVHQERARVRQDLGVWEGGARGAVREAFLEEVALERAAGLPGDSRCTGRCAHHSLAAAGQLLPATMPAGLHGPPWMPAWGRSGAGGAVRDCGAPVHQPTSKAGPRRLARLRPSPGGRECRVRGGRKVAWILVSPSGGTGLGSRGHTQTHMPENAHAPTGTRAHACTCAHTPPAGRHLPVSCFTRALSGWGPQRQPSGWGGPGPGRC